MPSICEMQGLNFFNNVSCTGLNFDTYFLAHICYWCKDLPSLKCLKMLFHLLPFLLLLIPGAVW